ncbi:MAG: methyl-accepting chemotaxis protein [Candidatus Eisenbacteria bacterium]|nr:methyl-accepting chemotaxis protein [Candidatus Eisenbacteria bacterium]
MNWTVRRRLTALSLLSTFLILAGGGVCWIALDQSSRTARDLGGVARALRFHLEVVHAQAELAGDVHRGLLATNDEELDRVRQDFSAHVAEYDRHRGERDACALDGATKAAIEDGRASAIDYNRRAASILAAAGRGDRTRALASLTAFEASARELEEKNTAITGRLYDHAIAGESRSGEIARRAAVLALLLPLLIAIALWLAARAIRRSIIEPVDHAVNVLDALSSGDLGARADLRTDDELGRMGRAIDRAAASLGTTISNIARNATSVGNASEELASVSQQLFNNAHETSTQSSVVSSASEEVHANVRLVAASAQEVGASIREVAHNAQEAAGVARTAVAVAERANTTVQQLGDSTQQIEDVLEVITSIAEQTNILALNAEIEAARAGEAGKGFAVVANEVKELARETARATEDINRRIDAIRDNSREAVATIGEIVAIIERINATQTTIASAVEQQSAATAEITRSMGEAARGTAEIAETIGAVARSTESTSAGARETQRAANELAMMAAELQRMVVQFRGHAGAPRAAAAPAGDVVPLRRAA